MYSELTLDLKPINCQFALETSQRCLPPEDNLTSWQFVEMHKEDKSYQYWLHQIYSWQLFFVDSVSPLYPLNESNVDAR